MKHMNSGKNFSKSIVLLLGLVAALCAILAPLQRQADAEDKEVEGKLILSIDGLAVEVEWEDNESVAALKQLVAEQPLEIQMSMYGGFEQVGPLGTMLPRNDLRTETDYGDIVLYSGNQLVIFHGSNAWAYTRLGHILDLSQVELKELIGRHDVTVTLALDTETEPEPSALPE